MDLALTIIGLLFVIIGFFGSFLPILPGPILSWVGVFFIYNTSVVPNNYWLLGGTLLITVLISVLDYIIPAQGTKRFGGSKYGIVGTNIGLVVGLIAPIPFGFIIGPFVGAFVGELYYNCQDIRRALLAATGSFIGFLASTFLKFVICVVFLGIYLSTLWQYRVALLGVK